MESLAGGAETGRTRRARCSAWCPPAGACRSARRSCSTCPNPELWEGRLRRNGDRFVPGLRNVEVVGLRTCARPQSVDGRPLLGEVRGQEGLWVAAGHGPWGISTGPASARIVADALLGRAEIPEPLSVRRPRTPPMPPPVRPDDHGVDDLVDLVGAEAGLLGVRAERLRALRLVDAVGAERPVVLLEHVRADPADAGAVLVAHFLRARAARRRAPRRPSTSCGGEFRKAAFLIPPCRIAVATKGSRWDACHL